MMHKVLPLLFWLSVAETSQACLISAVSQVSQPCGVNVRRGRLQAGWLARGPIHKVALQQPWRGGGATWPIALGP